MSSGTGKTDDLTTRKQRREQARLHGTTLAAFEATSFTEPAVYVEAIKKYL